MKPKILILIALTAIAGSAFANENVNIIGPLGQKTKAKSVPVVWASDQTLDVTLDPTNLATGAKQDTGNASLATIAAEQTAPTLFRSTSQGVTKATVATGARGLFAYNFINPNAYPVYVKFYDALVANVTVGTTTPKTTILVPSGGTLNVPNQGVPQLAFGTGITIAVTKLLADSDTTALDTAVSAEVSYK